jgi:uncharacterized repeat protein (TIGR03803 family)
MTWFRAYLQVAAVTALAGISGAFAPGAASAATLTTLHAFTLAEGAAPRGRLVQGTDGNFYGITSENGANGRGTVYRLTPGGSFTVLHSFANPDPSVGTLGSALVQGFDGYFYGVSTLGTGSVFKISSSGNYVLLHQFQGVPDGEVPATGLTLATDGTFYGTTQFGGPFPPGNTDVPCGTVYRITAAGTLTTLYTFTYPFSTGSVSAPHGCSPSSLMQASDGNFYGTTVGGTVNGSANHYGTIFRISPQGVLTTLHAFDSLSKGAYPPLVQGSDGNLYGTIFGSGVGLVGGGIYRITLGGDFTLLYSFKGTGDGSAPVDGLTRASDGNLYGTTLQNTAASGSSGGTVFQITPNGTLTTVHNFGPADLPDGETPEATVVQGSDGNLYGTTTQGGADSTGTIFKLSLGLGVPTPGLGALLAPAAPPRIDSNGNYTITLLVTNTSNVSAAPAQLSSASLLSVQSGKPTVTTTLSTLPVFLGDLVPGASVAIPLTFPITAGVSGAAAALRWNLNSGSGTSSGAVRLTLP